MYSSTISNEKKASKYFEAPVLTSNSTRTSKNLNFNPVPEADMNTITKSRSISQ